MMENTKTQSKKSNKIKLLVILIVVLAGSLIGGYFLYKNNKKTYTEEIIINPEKLNVIGGTDNYNLFEKIDSLKGEISTKHKVKDVNITINSGALQILNTSLGNDKKWELKEISFAIGVNAICIKAELEEADPLEKCFNISNYSLDNLGNIDTNDDDNDGLKNYEEIIIGTDKDKADSDDDGLSDFDEVYVTLSNPLSNKLECDDNCPENDAKADFDNDKISNEDELKYKTNPNKADTDDDGLNDYDEIFVYKTDPIKADSDEDGVNDYDEIFKSKTDPLNVNKTIAINKESEDNITTVDISNLSFKEYNTVSVSKVQNPNLTDKMTGYISPAYKVEAGHKFNGTISIKIDKELETDITPKIYSYDESKQLLEELPTNIDNQIASAKITTSSTYLVLDKNAHDKMWEEDNKELTKNKYNKMDIAFVIDISGSMDTNDPTDARKKLFSNFISSTKPDDKVATVLFKKDAKVLNNGFSKNENDKRRAINDVFNISNDPGNTPTSGTNISLGLYTAIELFKTKQNASRYIVVLTDGEDNVFSYPYDKIISMANEKNITIITIGLGKSVDSRTLTKIAEETGGKYYAIADASQLFEKYNELIDETLEIGKDSNNDGISDYITNMIYEGKLTTSTGINPFEGVSREELEKNDDYDGDGLKNGEELEFEIKDDKLYIKLNSDPLKFDTDEDFISDKDDASPFEKMDNHFIIVRGLEYKPPTPQQDEKEEKSNKTYKQDNMSLADKVLIEGIIARAELSAQVLKDSPASNALLHFLDNTGTDFNFDNDESLLKTQNGSKNFYRNTNKVLAFAEANVRNGSTLTFALNPDVEPELTGTDFEELPEYLAELGYRFKDVKWWYAIGYSGATIVAQITNNNGKYEMTYYYNIVDYYDWNKHSIFPGGFLLDGELFRLHEVGVAKQFRVEINYKYKITWEKGDRFNQVHVNEWTIPSSLKIESIN